MAEVEGFEAGEGEGDEGIIARAKRWLSIRNTANVVGSLALVFGAVYGWMEYSGLEKQKKVDRSFEYFDDYSEEGLFTARMKIWKVIEDVFDESNSTEWMSKENVLDQLLSEKMSEFPNYLYFDRIVEYFDSVNKCVVVGGCDPCTLAELLKDKAEDITWALTTYSLKRVENENMKYPEGLKKFQSGEVFEQCDAVGQG